MSYSCIHIHGNLISEEVLHQIEEGTAVGQRARDFGLAQGGDLRAEIEHAWSACRSEWTYFSERMETLQPGDPYGTSLVRRWMVTFFRHIGFEPNLQRPALIGDNHKEYSISHVDGTRDGLPIHIVGFYDPEQTSKSTLDIRSSGGTSRQSPHATVQEYLNVTDHVYGLTSNGLELRLLRDSGRLVNLSYLEVDLKRLFEEDQYSEFTILFRLLHSSRFPARRVETDSCWIEQYHQQGLESGNRIREGLSRAVQESMEALANGFITHPANDILREKLREKKLTEQDYYRQIRRLIYRFLFLLVTEERHLLYDEQDQSEVKVRGRRIYFDHYSLKRLRKLSENRSVYEDRYTDIWQGLQHTFQLFEANGPGAKLGLAPLAGDLFSPAAIRDLEGLQITNRLLLTCVRKLNEFQDKDDRLVPINYRALDVEELGSVYESLLELHPVIHGLDQPGSPLQFTFHAGTERKTTGSYYTRPDLVQELIKSALVPVIEQAMRDAGTDPANRTRALLALKVCDPAAGSGHMLLAAARTIAWYLARIETGEANPPPSVLIRCRREAIQHCIYGVDYNPDAVELCKLALWLESHSSGKPLSFLDHKIRNGNSLVGVTDLSVLAKGIPDDAYKPVTGDDAGLARALKQRNKEFRKTRQISLFDQRSMQAEEQGIASAYQELEAIRQDDLASVAQLKERFEALKSDPVWFKDWTACNLWTAAFFLTYTEESERNIPDSERLAKYLQNPSAAYGPMVGAANGLATEARFFHWPLEFPDVFARGGFDVMLGNPPWERIKLQQQEFFATRDKSIVDAPNAAARNRLIHQLETTNPDLYQEYLEALHQADATGKFLRHSERYELTAIGDINMYSVFAETFSQLIRPEGRTGFIVPTGIATDDGNKAFFGAMVEENRLVSLFDFENREKIFQAVDSRMKFCLLTLAGSDLGRTEARFGFFLTRTEHLQDKLRIFHLSKEDFLRLNPNTKTCPVFRTSVDAELTTKIYRNVPVLINEQTGENPWGVSFMRMFDMSNDSHLFRTREQLEAEGFELKGNRFVKGEPPYQDGKGEMWLPLYEAKMIWHYDHRFSTFINASDRSENELFINHAERNGLVMPWYWVLDTEVKNRLENKWNYNWFIGFRDIARSTDERTAIYTIVPLSGISNKMPLLLTDGSAFECSLLLAANASIVCDYLYRQKIASTSLNYFYVKQIPIMPVSLINSTLCNRIVLILVELIYSSWDVKVFIDRIWEESSSNFKLKIDQQWSENVKSKKSGPQHIPEWSDAYPEISWNQEAKGCPLPPFKWDEDRRAVLKAELDAIYAKLYGLNRDELRYILDPQDVYGPDFPGETFRVLKEKEIRKYGEYRTRRLVLEAWDRMEAENEQI